MGGDLLMPLAAPGQLLPVDSEHNAIFQCLMGDNPRDAHCIWLTCSGGPFFGRTEAELSRVTVHDALAHPTWSMGAKITIDSATLMNKGLERIEAMHLFGMPLDDIRVLIQRQSKIHSMVEFADGSVIAHLGASDMRIPIQFALSYPERWDTPAPRVDFRQLGSLEFAAPDNEAFSCLALAERAGKEGRTLPCVLNAANEVAVAARSPISPASSNPRWTPTASRTSSPSSSFGPSTSGPASGRAMRCPPSTVHRGCPPCSPFFRRSSGAL